MALELHGQGSPLIPLVAPRSAGWAAQDVAGAILYPASDLSNFVTSADLLVDGWLISSTSF
ncbi:hypothetical protein [Cryptosporangium minutisporangium]|uniref:SDR family oxidoreductase n=1 Tax=Cryptosporangium minutisporangium TaxID=113569 RepID=A0ABP6TA28_9ACTN